MDRASEIKQIEEQIKKDTEKVQKLKLEDEQEKRAQAALRDQKAQAAAAATTTAEAPAVVGKIDYKTVGKFVLGAIFGIVVATIVDYLVVDLLIERVLTVFSPIAWAITLLIWLGFVTAGIFIATRPPEE